MTDRRIIPSSIAIVRQGSGRVLMGNRRKDDRNFTGWSFPGGQINEGETPREACLRELEEETGLKGIIVRSLGVHTSPHPTKPRDYEIHAFEVVLEDPRPRRSSRSSSPRFARRLAPSVATPSGVRHEP